MHEVLRDTCDSLYLLSSQIIDYSNNSGELLINERGWNHPSLSMEDLAEIPKRLATRIEQNPTDLLSEKDIEIIRTIPDKIESLINNNIEFFNNGHGKDAIPAFIATLEWIKIQIEPLINFQILNDPKAMPAHLAKKLGETKAHLNEVLIEKDNLKEQINLINDATKTAESLPTDLRALKVAREDIKKVSSDVSENNSLIKKAKEDSDNLTSEMLLKSEEIKNIFSEKLKEADALIDRCEEAYKVNTTKGLAGAFEVKADKLSESIKYWVLGLILALIVGSFVGKFSYENFNLYLAVDKPLTSVIIMKFILTIMSLGAPLWFAWLSTKQISERFKLSEDYAFKASVAKAYEGYRREASRIDEDFEARLFGSALTRLEEEPLRHVKGENHGSPWQAMLNSKEFQNSMKNIPEFRDKVLELAKEGMHTVKHLDPKKNKDTKEESA